jgi:hypothetical protein
VREGRHRQYFTTERQAELLKPFLESASIGDILEVSQIKPQLEMALVQEMALSSVYKFTLSTLPGLSARLSLPSAPQFIADALDPIQNAC